MKRLILKLISYFPKKTQLTLKNAWKKQPLRNKLIRKKLKDESIQRSKKKAAAIAKNGTFKVEELISVLKKMNIQEGDILFVQTSFNDLYTLDASPIELLNALRSIVGESGTLLMPAYTTPKDQPDWVFDANREPTYTGIVNETFRRSIGVIRSLHPRHSICGIGPLAVEILADHEKCTYADGVNSPFDKMRKYPNAKILTLGLPKGFISFLHWIEDIEPEKLPFAVHNKSPAEYHYFSKDRTITKIEDYRVKYNIANCLHLENTNNKISNECYIPMNHKSIDINIYFTSKLAKELLRLRDIGIIHYL